MTAPTERPGGLDANARGIAVLVVAVLVGMLLLWQAGGTGGAAETAAPAETTTTVDTSGIVDPGGTTTLPDDLDPSSTAPTTTEARQPSEVSVVVLNGGGLVGAAGSVTSTIENAGYQTGAAANAADSPNVEATVIYYAEGFQTEAGAVAAVLGKDESAVQPLPTDAPPGPGADASNITVVLGKDVAPPGETTETTETN